jgi:hypothetical protein
MASHREVPGHDTVAKLIFARLEEAVIRREDEFGRERLLRTANEIDEAERKGHVAAYRSFIRSNNWPNHPRPSDFGVFCADYAHSAHQYVKIAFEALQYLAAGSSDEGLAAVYGRVVASEALRGQFGKRSPTGLDHRLDDLVAGLEQILNAAGVAEVDRALTVLGTPESSAPTAESLLLKDLRDLMAVFPQPPRFQDLLDTERSDIAWRVLRRHCGWSIEELRLAYEVHLPSLLAEKIDIAEKSRIELDHERLALVRTLRARMTEPAFYEFWRTAESLVTLNQLNLTLEPTYSFKGGPGLMHGRILGLSQGISDLPRPSMEELENAKWRLMSEVD